MDSALDQERMLRKLAATMVGIGSLHGVRTSALLTQMDTPLGHTAANSVDVVEALEVLRGGGPVDVVQLTHALAGEMLDLAGLADADAAVTPAAARARTWRRTGREQGVDPHAPPPKAAEIHLVTATRSGAGRVRNEELVSSAAGVVWHARPGEPVRRGQTVFVLHTDEPPPVVPERVAR